MNQVVMMDVDGTLTPPRMVLHKEMADCLTRLRIPFYVAAGSDINLVGPQFLYPLYNFGFRGTFSAFLSNGATEYTCDYSTTMEITQTFQFDICKHLGDVDLRSLLDLLHCVAALPEFQLPSPLKVIGDQIIMRGSMINFAPIGRPKDHDLTDLERRNRDKFVEYDAETQYRWRILDFLQGELSDLYKRKQVIVMLGGQTSFDVMIEAMDKTYPIRTLLKHGVDHILFIGDALFPGGNDSVVADFVHNWNGPGPCPVEAIEVQEWKDTIVSLSSRGLIKQSVSGADNAFSNGN
jgi:hydroxymethylpyrimidine pyrophosphatase-like HAD family hydrolase